MIHNVFVACVMGTSTTVALAQQHRSSTEQILGGPVFDAAETDVETNL